MKPNWDDIPLDVKPKIRDQLYLKQCGLCGYCEGSLGVLGRHIEHIEPRGGIAGNPGRTYVYENMVASCQGDTVEKKEAEQDPSCGRKSTRLTARWVGKKKAEQDPSCGHFKDEYIKEHQRFVLADFISPREAGCDRQFRYLSDGRVVPAAGAGTVEYLRAEYTIAVLGLNCDRLVECRKVLAKALIESVEQMKHSPAALQALMDLHLSLTSDSNGKSVLRDFYSTRKQFLNF
ncbi:MAG: TIGR02646 family protein [Deltaproteobacteria bacterium]|nr:TIGR02646 family protein [Deltaproteobacteria bacterium]